MGQRSCGLLVSRGLAAALLLGLGVAHAGTFDVTISSPSLFGNPAVLAFDFIDGGTPDNTVTLTTLISDGTQTATDIDGNVSGTGPWTFSDAPVPPDPNPSSFNELRVTFDPMGSAMTFSFTTSDNPPDGGSSPDAFSLFILNPDLTFLITTSDPTNALFVYNIGQGANGLSVFTPDQSNFSFSVTPAQAAPEPASLALLAVGLAALSTRRRRPR